MMGKMENRIRRDSEKRQIKKTKEKKNQGNQKKEGKKSTTIIR